MTKKKVRLKASPYHLLTEAIESGFRGWLLNDLMDSLGIMEDEGQHVGDWLNDKARIEMLADHLSNRIWCELDAKGIEVES